MGQAIGVPIVACLEKEGHHNPFGLLGSVVSGDMMLSGVVAWVTSGKAGSRPVAAS